MTPTKLRTEPPQPGSWIQTERVVIYRDDGKEFRCSESSWPEFLAEVLESQRKEQKRA